MARKKSVNKKTRKKPNLKNKIKFTLNRLLFFVILSLISFVVYSYINNDLLNDLFFVMTMVFGFISVGFLVVLLILFIMKNIKK